MRVIMPHRHVLLAVILTALVGEMSVAQVSVDPRHQALVILLRELAPGVEQQLESQPPKCSMHILAQACSHWDALSLQAKEALAVSSFRPARQTSRLSPSGHFRIHYDTTGVNQPALLAAGGVQIPNSYEAFVDSALAVFDYCWDVEVNQLGYDPPPSDGTQGGGPEYDVYLGSRPTNDFGITWFDDADIVAQGALGRDTTYMEIDNDFAGFRTPGLDGLKVTAAHEFFHAIQVGRYGIWTTVPNSDLYFYELSAVWMEHVLYKDIRDYLFDVPKFFLSFRDFQRRSYSFTTYSTFLAGYERSVFAHFLAKRFGGNMMHDIWTAMREQPFLESLRTILLARGTDLPNEFAKFYYWNFYTADRADTTHYYPEGNLYPRMAPNLSVDYTGFSTGVSLQSYPLSGAFVEFHLGADSVTSVVVNVDAVAARIDNGSARSFDLRMAGGEQGGAIQTLADNVQVSFTGQPSTAWRILYFSGNSRTDAGVKTAPSPNPLRLSDATPLLLPLQNDPSPDADVSFLSGSLSLSYSGKFPVTEAFGKRVVSIPVQQLRGDLASGVYFVIARTQQSEHQWKILVLQ